MNPENTQIMPGYFLVRINKQQQQQHKQRISKDSPFFMPPGLTFNSRNMEYGDILQIGEDVSKIEGWENCQPGHILCFHHTVEDNSNTANKQFWVFEDEEFNYYAIDELNIRAYYDGKTIVPHPNFVFLKNEPFESEGELDNATGNKIVKTDGGLYEITNWEDNAGNIAQKSEKIKQHIESLAKSKRTDEIQLVMEDLERQRIELNRKAQRKFYLPYRLAYSNSKLDQKFSRKLVDGDVLFAYNKACLYMTNFQLESYKYIICNIDYIGGLLIQ